MSHDVFVSYSNHDKLTADAVVARLEAAKLRCWIAPRDILPGMEWGEAIIDGINRSRVMVLVFSSSANASPQIRREVERAVNKGLPIIPFRIEEILPSRSLEYFLSSPHWLDALTPPVEAHIQKLADSVRALLARMDGAATQTATPPPAVRPRARVRNVIDTVLGTPAKVVDTGPVPGLSAAPRGARKRVTKPPAPPVSARRLLIVFVAILAIVLAILLLTGKPSPHPESANPPAVVPTQQRPAASTALSAAAVPDSS